jgi:hypothetical protein
MKAAFVAETEIGTLIEATEPLSAPISTLKILHHAMCHLRLQLMDAGRRLNFMTESHVKVVAIKTWQTVLNVRGKNGTILFDFCQTRTVPRLALGVRRVPFVTRSP